MASAVAIELPGSSYPTRLPSSTTSAPRRSRSRSTDSFVPTAKKATKQTTESKENERPEIRPSSAEMNGNPSTPRKGKAVLEDDNPATQVWRDGSLELEDGKPRQRKNPPRSARPSGINGSAPGMATLPTIPDPAGYDEDSAFAPSVPSSPTSEKHPPPAPSTQTGTGERPVVTRKRRSSSIKRKPSPGATPTKVVDWEIPRKTLHSSIGFLTLALHHFDPPTVAPIIQVLSVGLALVLLTDLFRLRVPAFAEVWEQYLGFLMRESERDKINGVVWYLVGVIFVLSLYPRDVAVVSILTLSWSDTTASTIGRLWGRYTKPLPSHFPGLKWLKFAPRKSLAGFLAAAITGFFIGIAFWWGGSQGRWVVLDVEDYGHGYWGLWATALVVGFGGAVVEALDLGVDDNLTLPILSGAVVWAWLATTNYLLG
ncbi:hypothetical protein IAU60_005496 [Kwoniella sp. DSM 27419]